MSNLPDSFWGIGGGTETLSALQLVPRCVLFFLKILTWKNLTLGNVNRQERKNICLRQKGRKKKKRKKYHTYRHKCSIVAYKIYIYIYRYQLFKEYLSIFKQNLHLHVITTDETFMELEAQRLLLVWLALLIHV